MGVKNIIFDFGGVLIDWNPRYLYRKIFGDHARMEHFLNNVCTQAWNERHDEGHAFADNGAELAAKYPQFKSEISAYNERWPEMLNGPIHGTVELLEQLKRAGRHRLLGLTNWSAEKFPVAEQQFEFLKHFEGIVVSGRIGLKKPDPKIFEYLCRTHGVEPGDSLFIDDSAVNIEAAERLGFHTERFRTPELLKQKLTALKVI